MEHIKILGYFKEDESKVIYNTVNKKLLYFVAYENEYNYSQNDKQEGRKWVEGYNVVDGHFQLQDRDYLTSCEKITKEEYLEATKGWYTPNEYL